MFATMTSPWTLQRYCLALAIVGLGGCAHSGGPPQPTSGATSPPDAPSPQSPGSASDQTAAGAETEHAEPSVEVLIDEALYVWDNERRLRRRYRFKYKLLRASALESDWSVISASWAPWHEEQPKLTATVTLPDGAVHTLDPQTLEISGTTDASAQTFSDGRRVRGPLPALAVGATVETTIDYQEHTPNFVGGALTYFSFGGWVPTKLAKVTLQAPAELPLNYSLQGIKIEPTRSTQDGQQTLVFEVKNIPVRDSPQPSRPPSSAHHPFLKASVAKDWASIAQAYAAKVDERLKDAPDVDLPEPPGADRAQVITAALAALHAKVRYTGLEFGAASLIPANPAQVLKRGYGDCKDKATLLVSMLKRRGIEAQVALLKSGYASPTLADVPSISHFNHAIVYVPGDRPLWLDATVQNQPINDIPVALQGRQALIASPKTKALLRIPELDASMNRYFEVREVRMLDFDAGSVAESSWGEGQMDRNLRYRYEDAKQADLETSLKKYVKRTYGADEVVDIRRTKEPQYRLDLVAKDAHWIDTGIGDATVPLDLNVLFEWLPKAAFVKKNETPARTEPLFFYQPYSAQLDYIIHPPDGFLPRVLPTDEQIQMGPALLTRKVTQSEGLLKIRYTFTSGKRTWTVQERAEFSKVADELKTTPQIAFDHQGDQLLSQGKTAAGLRLFQGAVAQAPQSSIRHARLAYALLGAGFGEAARDAARRAVKLAPKSFLAQHVLGETLLVGPFGRQYWPGMDRAGAIEAFGKTISIAPESPTAHHHLGRLLMFNDDTLSFGTQQELKDAITHLRKSHEVTPSEAVVTKLWTTLWASGDYGELKKELLKAPAGLERNSRLVAAYAVTDSVQVAQAKITELEGASFETVIPTAVQHLLRIRKYGLAAALATPPGGAATLGASQQSGLLRELRPWQDVLKAKQGPEQLAARFIVDITLKDKGEELWPLMSKAFIAEDKALSALHPDSSIAARNLAEARYSPRSLQLRSSFGTALMLDSALGGAISSSQGDDEVGYMVTWASRAPGTPTVYFFILKEGGQHKIRATSAYLAGVGAQTLRWLKQGNLTAALQWLDWAKDVSSPKEKRYSHAAFRRLWSSKRGRDRAAARLAASALLADSVGTAKGAVQPLKKALRGERTADTRVLTLALHQACLFAKDKPCAKEVSQELYERNRDSKEAVFRLLSSLMEAGDSEAAERLIQEDIEPADPDRAALLMGTLNMRLRTDIKGALKVLSARLGRSNVSSTLQNNYAWFALFADPIPPDAVAVAERVGTQTKFNDRDVVHTLGCLYAARGDLSKALLALKQLTSLSGRRRPRPSDWYLLGRIAEGLDLNDTAKRAYDRIPQPRLHNRTDTWWLAQAGLKRLKSKRDTVRGNP